MFPEMKFHNCCQIVCVVILVSFSWLQPLLKNLAPTLVQVLIDHIKCQTTFCIISEMNVQLVGSKSFLSTWSSTSKNSFCSGLWPSLLLLRYLKSISDGSNDCAEHHPQSFALSCWDLIWGQWQIECHKDFHFWGRSIRAKCFHFKIYQSSCLIFSSHTLSSAKSQLCFGANIVDSLAERYHVWVSWTIEWCCVFEPHNALTTVAQWRNTAFSMITLKVETPDIFTKNLSQDQIQEQIEVGASFLPSATLVSELFPVQGTQMTCRKDFLHLWKITISYHMFSHVGLCHRTCC